MVREGIKQTERSFIVREEGGGGNPSISVVVIYLYALAREFLLHWTQPTELALKSEREKKTREDQILICSFQPPQFE